MSTNSMFLNRALGSTVARYGWYLALIPIVFSQLGVLRAITTEKTYLTSVSVAIGDTALDRAVGTVTDADIGPRRLQRELATAKAFATRQKVQLSGSTGISANLVQNTVNLVFNAQAKTAKAAADAATSYAQAYLAEASRRAIEGYKGSQAIIQRDLADTQLTLTDADPSDRTFLQNKIADLRENLFNTKQLVAKATAAPITLSESAPVPSAPTNRSVLSSGLLGFVFGLGVCAASAVILDFGDKKRVTLEDLRIALPEVRILGITTSRKLGQAELAGHTIRNAIEAAGSSVLCAVFVGRGLKPNKTTRSIVSALNIRSTTAVQLRLRAEEDAEFHVQVESPDVWSLNSSRSSEWFEGRDLVAKQFVDYGVALAIIAGPILSNINENPSALSIADHYLLIVDSASSTKKSLSEAILLLESMERPVLGVLFIDR